MRIIKITRNYGNEKQTLGTCTVFDKLNRPLFSCLSLERGWLENKQNISCVPVGSYKVVLEYSPKFNAMLWELKGVKNRSECKFHAANFWFDLNGCIALGNSLKDINKDGYYDVLNSSKTMQEFNKALQGETEVFLTIS